MTKGFLASDRGLALLILVSTLGAWLPRIWIIPVGDVCELSRIVGSLALGLGAAFGLLRRGGYTTPLLLVFAVWSAAVWGRTMWNYWSLDNTFELRAVHTILTAAFLYLAWRAVSAVRWGPP